ncbi:MAG: DUF6273 domain-containing protein [Oscillospiraceae bacterium]|nr:DUF6273 domain-containing protein [Oscillospiraceae bacterium]
MTKPKIGDIIKFGEYHWLVLDVQKGIAEQCPDKALIITRQIIGFRRFHAEEADVTWENCTLREYLNGEFLDNFDSTKIAPTTNTNPNNPWYDTDGGNPTIDSIFLLSLDEVCKYFGDSTAKLANREKRAFRIDDENSKAREALYEGNILAWWLRSPGSRPDNVAAVTPNGHIHVHGGNGGANRLRGGGVRPALWLNACGLESVLICPNKVKKAKNPKRVGRDITESSACFDWSTLHETRNSDSNFKVDGSNPREKVINTNGDTWLEFESCTDVTYDRDPEARACDYFRFCYRGFSAKLRFEEVRKHTSPFCLDSVDTEFLYYSSKDEFFAMLERNGVSSYGYEQTLEAALRAYWTLARKSSAAKFDSYYRV